MNGHLEGEQPYLGDLRSPWLLTTETNWEIFQIAESKSKQLLMNCHSTASSKGRRESGGHSAKPPSMIGNSTWGCLETGKPCSKEHSNGIVWS